MSVTDFKQAFGAAFVTRDFQSMWFALNAKYKALDFHDDLTDTKRIEEYKYVVSQFRKFLENVRKTVDDCISVDEIQDVIEYVLENSREYGKERKEIVYNFVRDDWLYEALGFIEQYKNLDEGEEE